MDFSLITLKYIVLFFQYRLFRHKDMRDIESQWQGELNYQSRESLSSHNKGVALLSLIVIVQQSSSFVFVWLCIVLRCWLLLSLLFD